MKNSLHTNIRTFEELKTAERNLADEIKELEDSLMSNPIITIPSAIFKGGSVRSSLKSSMSAISFEDFKKSAINLISTALLANRRTRKFFVAFVIAKEMVPFVIEKVGEQVKKE